MQLKIGLFVLFGLLLLSQSALAQQPVFIDCGTVIEAELTAENPMHNYELKAPAGTTLNGKVEPFGANFNVLLSFRDSGDNPFVFLNTKTAGSAEEFIDLVIPSTNPIIRIAGAEPSLTSSDEDECCGIGLGQYFGAYTLIVGCTLRDGTVIEPGDSFNRPENNLQPPTFSGVGFPGLAAMDFINGVTIPFTQGVPNTGSIAQGFDGVFGFTLDVNAGETYTFDFNRVSGKLNLAIAILSPDNQIVFYGGMITSNRLSTDVLFPAAGQYTIGVYRVDFMPPGTPENTAFQVTATLQ